MWIPRQLILATCDWVSFRLGAERVNLAMWYGGKGGGFDIRQYGLTAGVGSCFDLSFSFLFCKTRLTELPQNIVGGIK